MKLSYSHREIFRIALPSIATNITVPLLGLVDVAIVGHLGGESGQSAPYIGAIAVGGLIFNMIYWLFGFLRMGTSGMTAQAYGQRNPARQIELLIQAVVVALSCGLFIFLLQYPIRAIAQVIIAPSPEVWHLAVNYFNIRIWAAPAALLLFAFTGWFVGMQNSLYPLYIAIGQNVINLTLSALFVFVFDMGIEGVALGTVAAQYAGLLSALLLWLFHYLPRLKPHWPAWRTCIRWEKMQQFFTVNRDIFLRTLCLISVTCAFTGIGARQGDMQLAVNTLLIQLFLFFSYFTDGFALAGEALSGKYIGAGSQSRLNLSVRNLFIWCGSVALFFSLSYTFAGDYILGILTDDAEVIAHAMIYMDWTIAIPLVGFTAFLWDGIFIGATATRPMLITVFFSSLVFFGVYYLPHAMELCGLPSPTWMPVTNHRLWLAFCLYLAVRSIVQSFLARQVLTIEQRLSQPTA